MGCKTFTKGSKTRLSTNFNSTEFDCHGSGCCTKTTIDTDLVEYLQKIREHFGKPITISSGYRCSTHNKNVGGSTGSRHAKGMAADIVVKDVAPAEVAKYCESIGILGIGLYSTASDGYFVHIDTRTTKAFWYGQAQAPRTTFGGSVESQYTLEQFVKDVQRAIGVAVTGKADDLTLRNTVTISNTINNRHTVIKAVQKRLLALGYSEIGTADGVAGAKFKTALTNFQNKNGCTPTGIAEEEGRTWKKLLSVNE
jgi:hypothetical protein